MLMIQRPTVEALDEEEGHRQRFAVGPLDPGFGHTLGNSLRRTLLSSIPGAAVTQVRFDEALVLRFDKRGPGDATAADLQVSADVEVLNPELHIASLNAKGRLALDVT